MDWITILKVVSSVLIIVGVLTATFSAWWFGILLSGVVIGSVAIAYETLHGPVQ